MPKPSKSSATSSTRKKHARKATENEDILESQSTVKSKPTKKQIKKGLAPPLKKSYIPPSKSRPTAHETDPLDEIEFLLPPELVVILRRLGKKDSVTKLRALEELEKCIQEEQRNSDENVQHISLINALPVWLFRYPALTVHPSRRIRHLAAIIQALLIEIPQTRKSIVEFVDHPGSESDITRLLGCWCLSRWDVDRSVAMKAQRSWSQTVRLESSLQILNGDINTSPCIVLDIPQVVSDLLPFLITGIMDPAATYLALYPSPVNTAPAEFQRHLKPAAVLKSTIVEPVARNEEDLESSGDRNARIRISALNAFSWILSTSQPSPPLLNILLPLYSSPVFWTILYHSEDVPYLPKQAENEFSRFGENQPGVRRAGWDVVKSLLTEPSPSRFLDWINEPDLHHAVSNEDSILKLMSCAVLRSAFTEPDPLVKTAMWRPLLVYLTKIDGAWKLSRDYELEQNAPCDDSRDDERGRKLSTEKHDIPTSYVEFQSFLSLGCNGSPVEGYSTILVILSTIPPEILPFTIDGLSSFFDSLWSAVDGRALGSLASEKVKATQAFTEAWSECLIWIVGKLIKSTPREQTSDKKNDVVSRQDKTTVANDLVNQEFNRFMSELWGGLHVGADFAGQLLANTLQKLNLISEDLLCKAWLRISDRSRHDIKVVEEQILHQALPFIAALYYYSAASTVTQSNIQNLVTDISTDIISEWNVTVRRNEFMTEEEVAADSHGKLLQLLLEHFGNILGASVKFLEVFDKLLTAWPRAFVSRPSLVLAYLKHIDPERRDTVWAHVLRTLGSSPLLSFDRRIVLFAAFVRSDRETLQGLHEPDGQELSILADQIMDEALTGNQKLLDLTVDLLRYPQPFITGNTVRELISSTVIALDYQLRPMIEGLTPSVEILISSLKLLLALEDVLPIDNLPATILENTLPRLFIIGFVLPEGSGLDEQELIVDLSKRLWNIWQTRADERTRNIVLQNTRNSMKSLITDTRARPQPVHILEAIAFLVPDGLTTNILGILPAEDEFLSLLTNTPSGPNDESLAILNFFASCSEVSTKSFANYDYSGFSSYGRAVKALIHMILGDRHFARTNVWGLQHILVLEHFATEALQLPHIAHPVFSKERIATTELKEVVQASQRIAAYILASAGKLPMWHADILSALSETAAIEQLDSIGQFIYSLFKQSQKNDTFRECFVLYKVLQHILPNADTTIADKWVDLVRQIELHAPRTGLVISRAVSEFAPGCSKLDRYRNEIASKLSSIPPSQANTHGLRLLQSLAAVAPHPDSDVIFLPHQRAVYLIQTLQRWFSSDEDIDEDVERGVALVIYYLVPVLQTVQGSHWEFILDLVESNLENCSFKDRKSLVLLARSLHLTDIILDITKTSKYLRELWKERSKQIFILVRNLLEAPIEFLQDASASTCREYALVIVQELPLSLVDEDTLSKMCHTLQDSAVENQKLAYFILRQAATKRTEHFVVEVAVDTPENDATVPTLPLPLVELMRTNIGLGETKIQTGEILSFLLAWMLCFDLFIDASVKVKSAYVDHMRKLDLIGLYLLPNIFGILDVGYPSKAFKLDPWIVDEHWLHMYDAEAPHGLQLLAAHVYYRGLLTVPSMIRAWWESLKDRQLSSAIASYTSTYFSPVLVASEFLHVKPSTQSTNAEEEPLTDDTFKIKVAQATNEVTASFLVDEQQMEVGIKLPPDYPLHTVEVRAIRKVGVNERMWRRWLFAVQQVMTTHNGRIVDGLVLFKKTVGLHFEGQAECAICYSILHVVDHSLPTKPCRTCKNRFHAGCLYKWFNTSHSSSCPLCRSDIM